MQKIRKTREEMVFQKVDLINFIVEDRTDFEISMRIGLEKRLVERLIFQLQCRGIKIKGEKNLNAWGKHYILVMPIDEALKILEPKKKKKKGTAKKTECVTGSVDFFLITEERRTACKLNEGLKL